MPFGWNHRIVRPKLNSSITPKYVVSLYRDSDATNRMKSCDCPTMWNKNKNTFANPDAMGSNKTLRNGAREEERISHWIEWQAKQMLKLTQRRSNSDVFIINKGNSRIWKKNDMDNAENENINKNRFKRNEWSRLLMLICNKSNRTNFFLYCICQLAFCFHFCNKSIFI